MLLKPGLSLRVSQHLALTPQLQQSIWLLQLSTLELSQEVEHMLDDNPFLERTTEEAEREEFGLAQSDVPAQRDDYADDAYAATASTSEKSSSSETDGSEVTAAADAAPDWEGDGSADLSPDDSEWGGEARARSGDDDTEAQDLAHGHESLTDFLHRQALSLRLGDVDRAALRFMIESLNEHGYLEDPLEELAAGLAGPDALEEQEELVHHFTVALRLLQSLEPVGVGARNLAECLTLQLKHLAAQGDEDTEAATVQTALRICEQPMDLLARRDVRRLMQACGASDERIRAAMALIARLEPRPGRRFADVERNLVVPDVLVRKMARSSGDGQPQFSVQLNPDVMPRLRVHDIYANALRGHKGSEGHAGLQQRLQEARWFI